MLRVKVCCCGCTLKAGTIMIMVFILITSLLQILRDKDMVDAIMSVFMLLHIISVGSAILGLFGVIMRKPILFIPFNIMLLIDLMLSIIFIMVIIVFRINVSTLNAALKYVHQQTTDEYNQSTDFNYVYGNKPEESSEKKKIETILRALAVVVYALEAVLYFYFFVVVLSYYHELREVIIKYPDGGVRPMPRDQPIREPYTVGPMSQQGPKEMEAPYPPQMKET